MEGFITLVLLFCPGPTYGGVSRCAETRTVHYRIDRIQKFEDYSFKSCKGIRFDNKSDNYEYTGCGKQTTKGCTFDIKGEQDPVVSLFGCPG